MKRKTQSERKIEVERFALYYADDRPRSYTSKIVLTMAVHLALISKLKRPVLASFTKTISSFEKKDPRWSQPYFSFDELLYLATILNTELEKIHQGSK